MAPRLLPERSVAPANRLLDLTEVKQHLRVLHADDDGYISSLILAAESWLDGFRGVLGRALVAQTWVERYSHFEYAMPLRLDPVIEIEAVTYFDSDNTEQAVAPAVWRLHQSDRPYLAQAEGQSWPNTFSRDDAVAISFRAGYGATPADVPEPIRHAARMLVGHWYRNREAVADAGTPAMMPMAVQALIAPFRAYRVPQ